MSDLFADKSIKPMLIAQNLPPFADPDYSYEMKWDGERCIAYLDPAGSTELINKRQLRMLPKAPELADICRQAKKRCILDGELLCLIDGQPDFSAIQRRSLMHNPFKIKLEAKRHPASFVAFDCLYFDGENLTGQPLTRRQEILQTAIRESARLAVSRIFPYSQALSLFELARQQNLEGIVAKRKDSLYRPGKRTQDWVKIKNLQDDDFIILGYLHKEQHMASVILGQYNSQGNMVYKGHATLGVSGQSFERIRRQPRALYPPCPVPPGNEKAIWVDPVLVCTISYLYKIPSGGMRHPVFKGLREDKAPADCKES